MSMAPSAHAAAAEPLIVISNKDGEICVYGMQSHALLARGKIETSINRIRYEAERYI